MMSAAAPARNSTALTINAVDFATAPAPHTCSFIIHLDCRALPLALLIGAAGSTAGQPVSRNRYEAEGEAKRGGRAN